MTFPRARSKPAKLALLLFPFVMTAIALRIAVAPFGDAIANAAVRAAADLPPRPSSEPDPDVASLPPAPLPPAAAEHDQQDGQDAPDVHEAPVLPRRIAARAPIPRERSAPSMSTIVVPASLVTRALERRDVTATNVRTSEDAPLGARLAGVGKYETGLRDGDVVVTVAGARTPTVAAMVSAAMAAASSGATRISGRILRGDATYAVVLELPKQ